MELNSIRNSTSVEAAPSPAGEEVISRRHLLWAVASLCNIHSKPFDTVLLQQQLSPPYQLPELLSACRLLGLGFEKRTGPIKSDSPSEFPALIFKKGENKGADVDLLQPALLVRADEDRLMLFSVGSEQAETVSWQEFRGNYKDIRYHITTIPEPIPNDEVNPKPARFDFRWFIPDLLRHKRIWRDVLLASLAIQVMALATPLFTQVVIDKVIVNHTMNTLYVVAFGLLMFILFSGIMTWVREYLVLHTGNRIDAVLGAKVFDHLFALPIRYFENRPTGTLVARVQGIETIREFITGAAVTLILDLPFLIVFLAVMFYYSWQLTLIVLAIVSVIAVLSLSVAPTLRRRLNEQFQLGARNQAFLTEYVGGMETVKSLQMEPQLRRRFGDYLADYLEASFVTRRLSNSYSVTANTLEQFQVLAILSVGAWLVMSNVGFTVGMLVAFQMFAQRMTQPVLRLVGLWLQFQQAQIAVKRLGDILDAPTEPFSLIPSREAGGVGKVEVSDLEFRYNEKLPYLYHGLDFTLEPGEMVVVMGPSGSGKSTLARLLQGFYQPSDGSIQIDKRDIRHLSANELRQYFGVVPQETTLFAGSIYDNLQAGNPAARFEQIIQACRMQVSIARLIKCQKVTKA